MRNGRRGAGPEALFRTIHTMHSIYLLKDLAAVSGYTTHTLKFYLRVGLIKEIGRTKVTNVRYFDDSSHRRLQQIRRWRQQNLTLKQIQAKLDKAHEER